MSGLRFCMITTFYPPFNFGGDGIGIQRLSEALVRRGHHVSVIHDEDAFDMLRRGPSPQRKGRMNGVHVHGLGNALGPVSNLLTHQIGYPLVNRGRIRRVLEEGDFDVINFHNISLVGGPGILGFGTGVKLLMAHDHWLVCPTHVLWRHGRERCDGRECFRCVLHHKRPPQLWRGTGLLERELQHVDSVIAMSEFSRKKHAEFGFSRPMEVLPYFLPALSTDTDGADEPSPHDRPYFLFVGRLERIKGLDDVIPLFREDRGADLLVAGDGEDAEHLRQLAKGLDRVRFLGRLPPEQLPRYYEHARALIMPSVCFETFGITLIEALRQGTPVIARRLGPFPEIVARSEAGELFDTLPELEAAMARFLADDGHRERLGEAGRAAHQSYWSEDAVIPQYLDIVAAAAERRGLNSILERLGRSH